MSYSSEVLADSPLAYWRLGEASGGTLVDSSGNGAAGTYSGTIAHVTGLVLGGADTCVDFNGTNSSADTPAFSGGADPTRLSVEALVSLDANNKLQIIHTRANESGTNRKSFRLAVSSANHAVFEVWIGGTLFTATSATTLSVGTTYHLAGTFDESNVKVYVNGSPDGTTAAAGSLTLYGTGLGGLLGAGYNGSLYGFFDGKIDEVAYYGSALSSTRIAAHYAAATVSPDATVVAPAASATAAAVVPVVSAASSVAPPAATASGAAFAPSISGTGTATVAPPAATSTAAALPPTLTADATVAVPVAAATAAGVAPTVAATSDATVVAVVATATAIAPAPAVTDGSGNRTVSPPAATATATALAPTITQVISAGTDTSNSLNGRRRRARASVVVVRPAAATPSRAAVKYDKSVPYPPPTLVNGRPT